MKYFSLDLETTGLDPDSCQILEFGAIFEDTDDPKSYEESSKFHAILKHDQIVGQPFALQLNNRLLRIISGIDDIPEGCEIYESDPNSMSVRVDGDNHTLIRGDAESKMINDFIDWCQQCLGEKNNFRINVAGKNVAGFDISFLKPHIPEGPWGNLFRHRVLDPSILYFDEEDEGLPNLETCLYRAKLGDPTDLHSALGDCWDVIRLLRNKL